MGETGKGNTVAKVKPLVRPLREYPYHQNALWPFLGLLLFGWGAPHFASQASTNSTGTVVRGMHLDPGQATAFYWIMSGAGLIMIILALFELFVRVAWQRSIKIWEGSITIPKSTLFSPRHVTVPYSAIRKVKVVWGLRYKSLGIDIDSRRFCVLSTMLPKKEDLDELLDLLRDKCGPGVVIE
jgi:hypothetical protein